MRVVQAPLLLSVIRHQSRGYVLIELALVLVVGISILMGTLVVAKAWLIRGDRMVLIEHVSTLLKATNQYYQANCVIAPAVTTLPVSVTALVNDGYLNSAPANPYGGAYQVSIQRPIKQVTVKANINTNNALLTAAQIGLYGANTSDNDLLVWTRPLQNYVSNSAQARLHRLMYQGECT